MVVISKSFSTATTSLKIGTLVLFICLVVYVVGFSVARWATITFSSSDKAITMQMYYHAGLWLHCGCVDLGEISCMCHSRAGDPGWFHAVQTLEATGLVGLTVALFISLALVFYKQNMVLRKVNIFLLIGSVIFIVVGLIIFGIESMEDVHGMLEMYSKHVKTHGSLSISFILCSISMCVCFFVCLPLFAIDLRTPTIQFSTSPHHIAQGPVQYLNQGQVIIPPSGQAQMVISPGGQQNLGYVQAYTYGQCIAPPEYASSGQNLDPNIEQTDGIPHKE